MCYRRANGTDSVQVFLFIKTVYFLHLLSKCDQTYEKKPDFEMVNLCSFK